MKPKLQLKVLFFLQFCLWGSWLTTFGSYILKILNFDGISIGIIYSSFGIAAIFMPILVGMIADEWISAKWIYMFCHTIGAITLSTAATVTTPIAMFIIILLNALVYTPTLGLVNTISFYHLKSNNMDIITNFPLIRIWGTIGFVFAMWSVSFSGLELSHMQFYIGAVFSVILVLFTLTLPYIPIFNQQKNKNWSNIFDLNISIIFKNRHIVTFLIFSIMLGAELHVTNIFGNAFLHSFDNNPLFSDSFIVKYASIVMSISQISEILFILTIPFFMNRYGIKNIILISIFAWMLRFGLFAYSNPKPLGTMFLILSMIVYGCAFDFFNISGSVFIEQEVKSEIRSSAQGIFLMMTNGFGCIIGSITSGKLVSIYMHNDIVDWKSVWLIFSGYSLILAFLFVIFFKYKHTHLSNKDKDTFNKRYE